MNELDLIAILAETLGIKEVITANTVLTSLGAWDSLSQMTTIVSVKKKFGVLLNVGDIMKIKTVNDLYEIIVHKK